MTVHAETRYSFPRDIPAAVAHALRMLERDHAAVFGRQPSMNEEDASADVIVRYAENECDCPDRSEAFGVRFVESGGRLRMQIAGRDELGLVYGILHFSRQVLGVEPFWFWADRPPAKKTAVAVPCDPFDSPEPVVRFRGWFVNDEVCLIGWKDPYPPTREVWEPVFEALLRCGGNMVMPGTDLPWHGVHFDVASEMGLWITHHHAEPLGAKMFLRAYPGQTASYRDHPDLYERLWREAVDKNKHQKVVWVLSFRGQGDKPFWEDDPTFDTDDKRGELISRVIRRQYDIVREAVKDPVCCVPLYGEIAELYRKGHIRVPENVIKVWADNGYDKMVSRRQGNVNHRIPTLPSSDDGGRHGIYYHVTFHDLQASNHLTMFPSPPELICREIGAAFRAGAKEYVLVNCGNVRPHVYALDLTAELWNKGTVDPAAHLDAFVRRHYASAHDDIVQLYRRYFACAVAYGPHEDDRAGEEFYHHPARQIIGHWLRGEAPATLPSLHWATGVIPFPEQVRWFACKVGEALPRWQALREDAARLLDALSPEDRQRWKDHFLFHVELHVSGCAGFAALCKAYEAYEAKRYPEAFVRASQALRRYAQGLRTLREAEHGKWRHFYRADWLTNIQNTIYHVDALRKFLRMHGDSPDLFLWYRQYLMPESEKYIYLENTHRNPLSDDELADRLEEKFGLAE
ncbi:MAG: hypothetical protein BLM47_05215 [Candidatus Reconcilbacillus cellulovorans]|uniref:Beta-hexosaminidase bacterial type N-terminal domain-containing protein n=1 Tax=Candidatus Reconcilbacillus cellulovorans TaxID=1906605 RepID=A0A2A6E259_9BACL|nr:MAG: hypothetical protein BLM47_05215 [Candidatus Reconcilbacillus cellulovorans]